MKNLLIVVDMQKDFVDGALGTPEAVAIVENVCNKIQNFNGDIIVTYDTHGETYPDTREGRFLPVSHCIKGTPGWELDARVQESLADKSYHIIEKPTFGSVTLPEYVRAHYAPEELSIELIGLCTDICVVSNALLLKAHFTETDITVDSACCAGVTPESHNAALTTMKMCQITIK